MGFAYEDERILFMTEIQRKIVETHKKLDDGMSEPEKIIDLVCHSCRCEPMDVIEAIVASNKENVANDIKRTLVRIK